MDVERLRSILEQVQKRHVHYQDAELLVSQMIEEKDKPISTPGKSVRQEPTPSAGDPDWIAVIGMACRLPGAENLQAFWKNLLEGKDSISEIPSERWAIAGFYSPSSAQDEKSYSKWGGFLKDIARFDCDFFGLLKQDALTMDPQHLLALEIAWEVFEHAGYGSAYARREHEIGVYWGARGVSNTLETQTGIKASANAKNALVNTAQNMIAARISDWMNLRGPAVVVDTACSSSLVAVHVACQGIHGGDCDVALVGGVDLLYPDAYIGLCKAKALSPDGKCFTFDRHANGYVPGEGAAAVLLKPLPKALEDRDAIYAIIRGSAINNDGHTMGLTTPNLEGQKAVLRKTLQASKTEPATISFVETHGTGTTIGDPIEIKALSEVYRERTDKKGYCGIGSVKTNIGHLHCAAGMASFIKVVLCLHHNTLVPTLNCTLPNPRFNLLDSPFYIIDRPATWLRLDGVRRAAISSFGFGGTNCHFILEGVDVGLQQESEQDIGAYLLALSAPKQAALDEMAARYRRFIEENPQVSLASLCFTAAAGREAFPVRLAVTADSLSDLHAKLAAKAVLKRPVDLEASQKKRPAKVVFMFTGQGSLYPGVAPFLANASSAYAEALRECDAILRDCLQSPLEWYLSSEASPQILRQTAISQPVTFAVDYALARFWMDLGVMPAALIGHSLGELVAAHLAGMFSLEQALHIVTRRATLMQSLPAGGGMAALLTAPEKVTELLSELQQNAEAELVIAGYNGPENMVVSGTKEALNTLLKRATEHGIRHAPLAVSHAFHSPLVQPMIEDFGRVFDGITINPPRIPLVSNVSGKYMEAAALDSRHWLDHVLSPVQFAPGIELLVRDGYTVFLEVGPAATLANMTRRIVKPYPDVAVVSTLHREHRDWQNTLDAAGTLFTRGAEIQLHKLRAGGKRVALPTYPFQRQSLRSEMAPVPSFRSSLIDGVLAHTDGRKSYYKVLRPQAEPFVSHHLVAGEAVLAAACQWVMVVSAAQRALEAPKNTLAEIVHSTPLSSSHQETQLLKVDFQGTDLGHFDVASWDCKKGVWIEHARGKLIQDVQQTWESLEAVKKRVLEPVDAHSFYEAFQERGLDYGPYYRSVKKLWVGTDEALAQLHVSGGQGEKEYPFDAYPALLDGALQAIAALLDRSGIEGTFVPFFVASVQFLDVLPTAGYGHVRLVKISESEDVVRADVCIFNELGRVVACVRDFCLKRMRLAPAEKNLRRLFYQPVWESKRIKSPQTVPSGRLVVFCDQNNAVHHDVIRHLNAAHLRVVPVVKGKRFEADGAGGFVVNLYRQESYDQLVASLKDLKEKIWGFVHLWTCHSRPTDLDTLDALKDSQYEGAYSLFFLLQALATHHLHKGAKLLIASSNSQSVDRRTALLCPEKSTILGIVQTLPFEFENLACVHVDVDQDELASQKLSSYVIQELSALGEAPDLFVAYREDQRLARRVKRLDFNPSPPQAPFSLKDRGVYVIVGGLGSIGLALATFLAGKVRARLALLSRSPFPEEREWESYGQSSTPLDAIRDKIEKLTTIRALGSEVLVLQADVTDFDQMAGCAAKIRSCFGRIDGVFHAAGVLSDGLLINQSLADFQKVLFPKMLGTWVLDRVFDQDALDFLILFSGFVTYVGIIGQSNHAAADYFKDAFAHYRSFVKNDPTLVINWGIWGEIGVVADDFYIRTLRKRGFHALRTEEALRAFEYALGVGQVQVGICDLDQTGASAQPLDEQPGAELEFLELVRRAVVINASIAESRNLEHELHLAEDLAKLCGLYVFDFFARQGLFVALDEGVSFDAICDRCSIKETFSPLLELMLEMLVEDGYVHRSGQGYVRQWSGAMDAPGAARERFEKSYAHAAIYGRILEHCFASYADVLSGQASAVQVLFPAGSMEMLESLYELPSPHYELAAGIVAARVRTLAAKGQPAVLELGAGTGSFTSTLLPQLNSITREYCYTDIAPVLLNQARQKFGDLCTEYRLLDIERDPLEQEFAPHHYDVVVAANVLHATSNLKTTFANVKKLLKPGALLVMIETTRVTRFANLVFGLVDGWWKFKKDDLREKSALLSAAQWERVLTDHLGFAPVVALPFREHQTGQYPFSVIVAQPSALEPSAESVWDATSALEKIAPVKEIQQHKTPDRECNLNSQDLQEFIRRLLLNVIAEIVGTAPDAIDPEAGFMEVGVDSLSLVKLVGILEKQVDIRLYPTLFFEYQTVRELAVYLAENHAQAFKALKKSAPAQSKADLRYEISTRAESEEKMPALTAPGADSDAEAIAIIGMAGLFPAAKDLDEFWHNLIQGRDCVREIDPSRWDTSKYYSLESKGKRKTYCKWAGLVDGIDQFDAPFFRISPKEAQRVDPQQRIFMELAVTALENAGYGGNRLYGSKTGVFVGVSNHHYYQESFDPTDTFCVLGSQNGMVANRVSFFLNFHGPSLVIDTQCSSSLVALHYACQSLKNGECEQALVGGVNFLVPADYYVLLSQVKALSSVGKCQAFDRGADGFVSGEGAGAIVIKPLQKALADRDHIHAVIRGSAVNHDGRSNNVSAPNANAQAAVITAALKRAQVNPETISFVEAHGTGTSLGDPVEVAALTKSFRSFTDKQSYCALGAVKTNIGHLEAGAGLAGLIKVVLSMKHGVLAPSLHFDRSNVHLDLTNTPFYVVDRAIPWRDQAVRRAGISSFGMGGTNAHVIVQEAPPVPLSSAPTTPRQSALNILAVSAQTKRALWNKVLDIQSWLGDQDCRLADICFTANAGRGHYAYRLAILANSVRDLQEKIALIRHERLLHDTDLVHSLGDDFYYHISPQSVEPKIAFIFPPADPHEFDLPSLESDEAVLEVLAEYRHTCQITANSSYEREASKVAALAGQYACARLLKEWNVQPTALAGWGWGDYASAVLAGCISLPHASRLLEGQLAYEEIELYPYQAKVFSWRDGELVSAPIPPVLDPQRNPVKKIDLQSFLQRARETAEDIVFYFGGVHRPGDGFSGMAEAGVPIVVPLCRAGKVNRDALVHAVALAYTRGAAIDWQRFAQQDEARIIEFPTYPFEHKSYWVRKAPSLLDPFIINHKLKLKNRIVKSGIEIGRAGKDGEITPAYLDYYQRWSQAEIGLNIGGNFIVSPRGRTSPRNVVLTEARPQLDALRELVDNARLGGSKFILQLNYAGENQSPAALSAVDVESIVSEFAAAAEIASAAGGDGVQIHAAHEYLLARWLAAPSGQDSNGQVVEGRAFLNSIVRAIRARVRPEFVVSVKLNTPFSDQYPLSAQDCQSIAMALEQAGVDLIEFSRGIKNKDVVNDTHKSAEFFSFVKQMKEKLAIPVIVTGGMRDAAGMADLVESGATDLVGLGRPFIREPSWVKRLQRDASWKSRCTSCTLCYVLLSQKGVDCARSDISGIAESASSYCFRPVWKAVPFHSRAATPHTFILFGGPSALAEALKETLGAQGHSVVHVRWGAAFTKESDQSYAIAPGNAEDYASVLAETHSIPGSAVVIYLEGCCDSEETAPAEKSSWLYSLFHLAQALIPWTKDAPCKLLTVTTGACQVRLGERLDPYKVTLAALTRVIPYEIKSVDAKVIDITVAGEDWSSLVKTISDEATSFEGKMEELAYREKRRFVRRIASVGERDVAQAVKHQLVRSDGAYVVVGGLSGLGFVLAEYIASQGPQDLVLIGRQKIPPRVAWQEWLAAHPEDDLISQKIGLMQRLDKKALRVHYYAADIAARQTMEKVVASIGRQGLTLRGVIHCAGSLDTVNRSIQRKSLQSFQNILKAKIHGTAILYELLSQAPLDFMILCSSIAGLDGKLGVALADYAVANAFQDSFASAHVNGPVRIVSIAWPLWKNVGLGGRKAQGDFNWPISQQEGLDVLEYILASGVKGAIAVMNPQSANFSLDFFNAVAETEPQTVFSPGPSMGYHRVEAPVGDGEIEAFIEGLLVRFLQLERDSIKPHTPFADYGIDSVIVADMVGALEARFDTQLHPAVVLEHPTISRLAQYLRANLKHNGAEKMLALQSAETTLEKTSPPETGQVLAPTDDAPKSELAAILEQLSSGLLTVEQAMKAYGEMS